MRAALLLLSLVAGCAKNTEVLVVFSSDLPPAMVKQLHLEIASSAAAEPYFIKSYDTPADRQLEESIDVVNNEGDATGFLVRASLHPGPSETTAAIVSRYAVVPFYTGRSLKVELALDADCADVVCEPSLTCAQGLCVPPAVVPTEDGAPARIAPALDVTSGVERVMVAPGVGQYKFAASQAQERVLIPLEVGMTPDRILLVTVSSRGALPTSAAFGDVQMTPLPPVTYAGDPQLITVNVAMYYLLAPTSGTRSVTVVFPEPINAVVQAVVLNGVEQVAPQQHVSMTKSEQFAERHIGLSEPRSMVIAGLSAGAVTQASATSREQGVMFWWASSGTSDGHVESVMTLQLGGTGVDFDLGGPRGCAVAAFLVRPVGADAAWAHETKATTDRALVVAISTGVPSVGPTSVTYGGRDLTPIAVPAPFANKSQVHFYYEGAPPVGTADVTVTGMGGTPFTAAALGFSSASQVLPTVICDGGVALATSSSYATSPSGVAIHVLGTSGAATTTLVPATAGPERWKRTTGPATTDLLAAGVVLPSDAAPPTWGLTHTLNWTQASLLLSR